MVNEKRPDQPKPSGSLQEMSQDWGRLTCVYVSNVRGITSGDGKFYLGPAERPCRVPWAKGGADGLDLSVDIVGLDVVRNSLLITGKQVAGKDAGRLHRMLIDLANCVLCYEDAGKVEAPPPPATFIAGRFIGDILIDIEQGRTVPPAEVQGLKDTLANPSMRDRHERIKAMLSLLVQRSSKPVVKPKPEPGTEQKPRVSGGEADAAEFDDAPIPEGRIQTSDPRDRVPVMSRGK